MTKFSVYDLVEFQNTSDDKLDGKIGTVLGFVDNGYPIVLFDDTPTGYNPAIMISEACLKKSYTW